MTKSISNFKTILVPLDGSKYSEKALQRACELVDAFDSKIILVYVVEKSIPINLLDRKEYLTIVRKFGKKTLERATKTLSKKGITAKPLLKEGNIVSEIEKIVKNEKCDLIVVGNKGLGALTRFLLGSVSNKLAQHSPCSLLIVK
ncbi:UspA domain-containing protein [Candidatus Nitrosopumilus koreensis AR1]|uniref:UspA domain-containing protein n=1 Tax=Candidatus Nitrosopumilus koreensis AR1 TaxID=1229908 RepID=K0B606_9ARCH|nr:MULTISPECIES: universal stress protein [Nitrosopumilus]AFS80587.1 UspA domain-containing protein [Candidatus Nitrosopumilus koreensis AR1]